MPANDLSQPQLETLRALLGLIIPADAEFGVPGADDPAIVAAIVADIARGRDDDRAAAVAELTRLDAIAGGDFASLDGPQRSMTADAFRHAGGTNLSVLQRLVLQCYYRDDRVMRSLGMEVRPPFPKGHELPEGDWSLLDVVRQRPKLWRDAP